MATKTSIGAALGLISAGAGLVAYYYLFMLKDEKVKPEDLPDEVSEEPVENVKSNHNVVLTENIANSENEVDTSKTLHSACKTPPSTPVAEEINTKNAPSTNVTDEIETKKAAAKALIGKKLNSSINFQQFSQSKGLDVSKEVVKKKEVEEEVLKLDVIETQEALRHNVIKIEDLKIEVDKDQDVIEVKEAPKPMTSKMRT